MEGIRRNQLRHLLLQLIFVAAVSTLATVLSSACVAYAFSRVKYKGRNIWFTAMICTMMIPTQIILVPQYIIYNKNSASSERIFR